MQVSLCNMLSSSLINNLKKIYLWTTEGIISLLFIFTNISILVINYVIVVQIWLTDYSLVFLMALGIQRGCILCTQQSSLGKEQCLGQAYYSYSNKWNSLKALTTTIKTRMCTCLKKKPQSDMIYKHKKIHQCRPDRQMGRRQLQTGEEEEGVRYPTALAY